MVGIQRTRADQFATLGPAPGAVVFLGDSITEGGEWAEWFPNVPVSNRGIAGEQCLDLLRRLDSAVDNSVAVFLLAGTNDLGFGATPQVVASRLAAVLEGVRLRAPGADIYLQTVMPRSAPYAAEVKSLNRRLRKLADQQPAVTLVDLWPALSADGVRIQSELSFDSLHLNGPGYRAWTEVLTPHVTKYAHKSGGGKASPGVDAPHAV